MKTLFLSLAFVSSAYAAYNLQISQKIHDNASLAFLSHTNYLTMEVQYLPVKEGLDRTGLALKTRGEAHVTVITPVEYDGALSEFVKMREINALAQKMRIQSSRFEVLCLGMGLAHGEKTYYLVLKSPELLRIRQKIEELYVQRGGEPSKFKALQYYPHITVGFTERDLHESDGVIKNADSCIQGIEIF